MTGSQGNAPERAEKKIDESWKDSVNSQKAQASEPEPPAEETLGVPTILSHVSTLAMQALIFMGEIPNPSTDLKDAPRLAEAKYLIDTIQMLYEKTLANLTSEERPQLEGLLYELRLKFVEKAQGTLS